MNSTKKCNKTINSSKNKLNNNIKKKKNYFFKPMPNAHLIRVY